MVPRVDLCVVRAQLRAQIPPSSAAAVTWPNGYGVPLRLNPALFFPFRYYLLPVTNTTCYGVAPQTSLCEESAAADANKELLWETRGCRRLRNEHVRAGVPDSNAPCVPANDEATVVARPVVPAGSSLGQDWGGAGDDRLAQLPALSSSLPFPFSRPTTTATAGRETGGAKSATFRNSMELKQFGAWCCTLPWRTKKGKKRMEEACAQVRTRTDAVSVARAWSRPYHAPPPKLGQQR